MCSEPLLISYFGSVCCSSLVQLIHIVTVFEYSAFNISEPQTAKIGKHLRDLVHTTHFSGYHLSLLILQCLQVAFIMKFKIFNVVHKICSDFSLFFHLVSWHFLFCILLQLNRKTCLSSNFLIYVFLALPELLPFFLAYFEIISTITSGKLFLILPTLLTNYLSYIFLCFPTALHAVPLTLTLLYCNRWFDLGTC